ncbi:hypothetical protein D3C77_370660 [compost metagenome]
MLIGLQQFHGVDLGHAAVVIERDVSRGRFVDAELVRDVIAIELGALAFAADLLAIQAGELFLGGRLDAVDQVAALIEHDLSSELAVLAAGLGQVTVNGQAVNLVAVGVEHQQQVVGEVVPGSVFSGNAGKEQMIKSAFLPAQQDLVAGFLELASDFIGRQEATP